MITPLFVDGVLEVRDDGTIVLAPDGRLAYLDLVTNWKSGREVVFVEDLRRFGLKAALDARPDNPLVPATREGPHGRGDLDRSALAARILAAGGRVIELSYHRGSGGGSVRLIGPGSEKWFQFGTGADDLPRPAWRRSEDDPEADDDLVYDEAAFDMIDPEFGMNQADLFELRVKQKFGDLFSAGDLLEAATRTHEDEPDDGPGPSPQQSLAEEIAQRIRLAEPGATELEVPVYGLIRRRTLELDGLSFVRWHVASEERPLEVVKPAHVAPAPAPPKAPLVPMRVVVAVVAVIITIVAFSLFGG